MFRTAGPLRLVASCLTLIVVLNLSGVAEAQDSGGEFISGRANQAWEKWQAAMQAILSRENAKAEAAFGDLLTLKPSAFRIALFADYTVERTPEGGAVMLLEQDLEAKALGAKGQAVGKLLATGREQMNQVDDGFYFCQLGRFDVADANFRALLAADPDPVAVLEFTDRVPKRRDVLLQVIDNPVVGESVRQLFRLLDHGEIEIKADPIRISENIDRLSGPPRAFENAVAALRDSGEYAIPFVVQTLRDPAKRSLLPALLRYLPLVDRQALNPLVLALRMNDDVSKRYIVESLGKLGYWQGVPYLLLLDQDPQATPELHQAIAGALAALRGRGVDIPADLTAADAFLRLAEEYYADRSTLAADPRLDTANVWYWRDDMLQNTEVPTVIFNEIMCMRACEEALRLNPNAKPALALWLAANFRRAAQLGADQTDRTRPPNYPPPSYFAQSAGAEYCLMALARGVDGGDPAVALGTIEALYKTAGPASLTTDAGGRLPLAEALTFPDRMVRIRAGLTLGNARPERPFPGYQSLMPVLSEALTLYGGARNALVIDPDSEAANAVAAGLRSQGFDVLVDGGLLTGLEKVRAGLPGLDVLFISSDVRGPGLADGLAALRSEFRFASVPVVIVTKAGGVNLVRDLVRNDHRLRAVADQPSPAEIAKVTAEALHAVGAQPITPDIGATLARDAVEVLRLLASTNNPVFNAADAEPALLAALGSKDESLRLAIAEVLGYLGTTKAQQAIAGLALDTAQLEAFRVKMFAALAQAAKRRGNQLDAESVQKVVKMAEGDENMVIREAASQTLGALNLPGAPASEIIRNQYRG